MGEKKEIEDAVFAWVKDVIMHLTLELAASD
jgi:hypothetical protein